MQDFYYLFNLLLNLLSIDICIWGFHINLLSVFIVTALFSLVGYAISKLYD